MNASGRHCQHRFTRAENHLIPPLTEVQECNVVLCHQTSLIGGREEEEANQEFIYGFREEEQLSPGRFIFNLQ